LVAQPAQNRFASLHTFAGRRSFCRAACAKPFRFASHFCWPSLFLSRGLRKTVSLRFTLLLAVALFVARPAQNRFASLHTFAGRRS
jgi:hypothetical protein